MLLEMSMMPLSACPLWQTENPGQTAGECNDAARSYITPRETTHSVRDRAIASNSIKSVALIERRPGDLQQATETA